MSESTAATSIQAAIIARKYYLFGMSKSDIAVELGISRFRVARMLDDAVQNGIVHITIDVPVEYDVELGDRLTSGFGLRIAIVAKPVPNDSDASSAVIGAAAARFLESMVDAKDVIGISWGRTMAHVVESMSATSGAAVVQVAGGINSARSDVSGVELVHQLAAKIGGRAYPLLAPLLVGSSGMAAQLKDDPSLESTISRFDSLTVVLMGIGSWNPPHSVVHEEATAAERRALRRLGAAADLCGIVVDAAGREIGPDLQARRIGINAAQLRAVPTKIAVATGQEKAQAIAAALRSGQVDVLVTDATAATAILNGLSRPPT